MVLGRGFVKFDGNAVANGIQGVKPKSAQKPRDPSICPLLPSEDSSNGVSPKYPPTMWEKIHRQESQKIETTPPVLWPSTSSTAQADNEEKQQQERVNQEVPKAKPGVKIPQLKANKLDDISRQRAKEFLSEFGHGTEADGANENQLRQEPTERQDSKVLTWTPFDDDEPVQDDRNKWNSGQRGGTQAQTRVEQWGRNLEKARVPSRSEPTSFSPEKLSANDTLKLQDSRENGKELKGSPFPNKERSVDDSIDDGSIESQEESQEESFKDNIFMSLNPTEQPSVIVNNLAKHQDNQSKNGTEPVDGTKQRQSLSLEGQKTLTDVLFAGNNYKTPRELLSPPRELTPSDHHTFEAPSKKSSNGNDQNSLLHKFVKRAAPMMKTGAITAAQEAQIRRAAEQLGIQLHGAAPKEEGAEYPIPVPLDVKLVNSAHTRSSYKMAKKEVVRRQSIHFKRNISPTTKSLLDTESDFDCDSMSDLNSASHCSSRTRHINLLIDTKSADSGSDSILTYPRALQESHSPEHKGSSNAANRDPITGAKLEPEETGIPRKVSAAKRDREATRITVLASSDAEPLGATLEEIDMLNKFLSVAGPEFKGSKLSIEDREKIHDAALGAGLPETFINKVLDQSAGIIRWDEASVSSERSSLVGSRTMHKHRIQHPNTPGGSTCAGSSLRTKSTVDSDMSDSTRYTKDAESISCYTDDMTRRTPKTEVAGGYGCVGNFNEYFWMGSNLAGQEMMENVAAVMSGDSSSVRSDDMTWDTRERRRTRS
jgi:hypothetical protein